MNKDQVKGAVKEMAGKVQAEVGKATGSLSQQVKGKVLESEGRSQTLAGDVRELVKDVSRKL